MNKIFSKQNSSRMMMRSSVGRVAVASLIVAGSLSLGSLARAQQHSAADVAQARVLFNEGTTLRDKGNLAGALEKLRTAHSISATPITGLELGRTYQALGKLVEAREAPGDRLDPCLRGDDHTHSPVAILGVATFAR